MLDTYLNDHLAGAAAGVELAQRIEEDAQETPAGPLVTGLADQIEADRQTLKELMDYLGIEEEKGKQAIGWVAEKMSRLRLNRAATGSQDLALLLTMETLAAGIEGKRCLWQSLQVVAEVDPSQEGLDLDTLLARVDEQRNRLEQARRAIAGPALVRLRTEA